MTPCEEAYKQAHRAYVKDKDLSRALKLFEKVIALCTPNHEFKQYALAYKKNIELEMAEASRNESTNDNYQWHTEENSNRSKKRETEQVRILSCPSCSQKIRVRLPLSGNIANCAKCSARFKMSIDEEGHLYITLLNNRSERDHTHKSTGQEPKSINDCFTILEIECGAEASQVKAAYRKKMMEYHPDKVANLGPKLRVVAEKESKLINIAYSMLREHGCA
jgi:DnaJ-domain-containing protein 1